MHILPYRITWIRCVLCGSGHTNESERVVWWSGIRIQFRKSNGCRPENYVLTSVLRIALDREVCNRPTSLSNKVAVCAIAENRSFVISSVTPWASR